MNTLTDLRTLLAERAEHVDAAPRVATAAVDRASRLRVRRRVAAAGAAVVVAVTIAVPLVLTGSGTSLPPGGPDPRTGPSEAASSGPEWAPTIPGLDLPAGVPLDVPYVVGDTIVDGETEIVVEAAITQLLAVDDGYVVLSDDTSSPSGTTSTSGRLDFVSTDGTVTPLDTGRITGVAVDRTASANPIVAWDWQPSDGTDDDAGAVKALRLGTGSPPEVVPVDTPAAMRWVIDGDPVFAYESEDPSLQSMQWDLESGELTPWLPEPLGTDPVVKDVTPDGDVGFFFDNDSQCDSAIDLSDPATTLWEACEEHGYYASMSPDGRVLAGQVGAAAALTGDHLVDFDLPDQDFGQVDYVLLSTLGWESPQAVLLQAVALAVFDRDDEAATSRTVDSYVIVRCDTVSGDCETVPHPVDVLPQ